MKPVGRGSLEITSSAEPPEGWDDFLTVCPAAHLFHTTLWTRLVCRHYPDTQPLWLAARIGGTLVGGLAAVRRRRGLVRTLASHLDGTDGGPVVTEAIPPDEQTRVFTALLEAFAAGRGGVHSRSFTLSSIQEARFGAAARRVGWPRREVRAAVMPLAGGIDHVEMHVLKKNRRNERNRSLKWGCRAEVTADPAVLDEYYPIYLAAARGWGVEPAPRGLLADLLTEGEGQTFLSSVTFAGRVIGAHLNLHRGDRVTAWNGATHPEFNDKFPATLLIWTDLQEACRRKAAWLDLGGSAGITKLSRFKQLLGAEEEIRGHYEVMAWPLRLAGRLRRRLGRTGGRS